MRSAFASFRNGLESRTETPPPELPSPSDRLVTSAKAPIPNPAARPPYETRRLIRDAGTFLSLDVAPSLCKG